ncbi:hypothetical protein [Streptomyces sp. NPDC091212]|uniref:hypothetical protein n=1 Tax=Streptomyces sp. NPDC091212 TaxID=3155191 RepID=UPI0034314D19
MPEPLTLIYLREIQSRVTATRPGPWPITASTSGESPGFGPFSWVEAWDDTELAAALAFSSQARTDVPALLGEIARLKDRVRQLEHGAARRPAVLGGGAR